MTTRRHDQGRARSEALTANEYQALSRAGLDEAVIADIAGLARQTPWLRFRRWIWRPPNRIALIVAGCGLGFIASLWGGFIWFWTLAIVFAFGPDLVDALWRLATGALDPARRGARTALALSIRAKPDDGGGAGAAFAQLKTLTSNAQGLTSQDAVEALNRYQHQKDRRQLIALVIGLMLGATLILLMVAARALL